MPLQIFDIDAFPFGKLEKDTKRDTLVYMARVADAAERHNDMRKFVRKLVQLSSDEKFQLTVEERNLLSVAYKDVIGKHRAVWRVLNVEENKENPLIQVYKKEVEKEIRDICDDVLELLNTILIPSSSTEGDIESRVFYYKMAADYYRYLCEFARTDEFVKNAEKNYGLALRLAKKSLEVTDPIRLGLVLNYSVCCYEILQLPQKACKLAQDAFDAAMNQLDDIDDSQYKDSTLIMQLLRDNLTLWRDNTDLQIHDYVSDEEQENENAKDGDDE